jgi:ankyrin repeat/BTB/POZ domain-containing protein 1
MYCTTLSAWVQLSPENVFDVLCVADMYLLPGLKRLCGKTLAKMLCEDNVLHMWKTAKLFRLSRLEDQCTEYMAKIIERVSVCHSRLCKDGRCCVSSDLFHSPQQLVEKPEFADMIKEDAGAVEDRHETDSIPLVDDIRFHITSNVQTFSAIEEANVKLDALDQLLSTIGLEC